MSLIKEIKKLRHHKIYLVGQISSNPQSYEWRKRLYEYLINMENYAKDYITLLDPCKNSMNLNLIKQNKNDEKSFTDRANDYNSMNILAALDAGYVKESTICFANMNHFTPSRPIIGSFFELAFYYHNYPDKPVIGIFEGDPTKDYQCNHPFVQAAIDVWVKNENEAMDLIIKQCFC